MADSLRGERGRGFPTTSPTASLPSGCAGLRQYRLGRGRPAASEELGSPLDATGTEAPGGLERGPGERTLPSLWNKTHWQRTPHWEPGSGEPEPAQSGSPRSLLLTSARPLGLRSSWAGHPAPLGVVVCSGYPHPTASAQEHSATPLLSRWPRLSPLPAPPSCSCSLCYSAQGHEPHNSAWSHGTASCPPFPGLGTHSHHLTNPYVDSGEHFRRLGPCPPCQLGAATVPRPGCLNAM